MGDGKHIRSIIDKLSAEDRYDVALAFQEVCNERDEYKAAMIRSREEYHEVNGALVEALAERDALREEVERLVGAVDWNQNDAQNWRKQCQAEADLRARYRAALERRARYRAALERELTSMIRSREEYHEVNGAIERALGDDEGGE
jgi:DNA repair ATPase RecN